MKNKSLEVLGGFGFVFAAYSIQIIVTFIGMFILAFSAGIKYGMSGVTDTATIMDGVMALVTDSDFLTKVSFVAIAVTAIAFGFWYNRFYSKKVYVSAKEALSVKNIIVLLVLGLVTQICLSSLLQLILPLFQDTMESYSELMNMIVGGGPVMTLILTVILAPIAEECLFRGIIFKKFSKAMPIIAANILQALLFGIYHMNIVQGIYAFFIGLLLGFVAMRLKSLLPCILLHAAINGSGMIVGYILTAEFLETIPGMIASAVVSLAVGVVLFLLIKNIEEKIPYVAPVQPEMAYAPGYQIYDQNNIVYQQPENMNADSINVSKQDEVDQTSSNTSNTNL